MINQSIIIVNMQRKMIKQHKFRNFRHPKSFAAPSPPSPVFSGGHGDSWVALAAGLSPLLRPLHEASRPPFQSQGQRSTLKLETSCGGCSLVSDPPMTGDYRGPSFISLFITKFGRCNPLLRHFLHIALSECCSLRLVLLLTD